MIKIAPSILSADFSKLGEEIKKIDDGGAEYIHIDVMDGVFVPNLSMGAPIIKKIRSISSKIFDVHLMIVNPDKLIPDFAKAGADIITVHSEACPHLHRTIQLIKSLDKKAGVALNPHTPLSMIENIIQDIDLLLIMSVNPGFGGQSYIPFSTTKIKEAASLIKRINPKVELQVDGGITIDTIKEARIAGAEVFVAGSAVYNNEASPSENIKSLKAASN